MHLQDWKSSLGFTSVDHDKVTHGLHHVKVELIADLRLQGIVGVRILKVDLTMLAYQGQRTREKFEDGVGHIVFFSNRFTRIGKRS